MNLPDFNNGKLIQATISKITELQTKIALAGSKGFLIVVDGSGNEIISGADIVAAITQASFNTISANALIALSAALTAAKTAAQSDFDALGGS